MCANCNALRKSPRGTALARIRISLSPLLQPLTRTAVYHPDQGPSCSGTNPDLVVRDEDGNVTTVRYEAVNAMLLNEFLKEHQRAVEEHRKVEEQEAMIARQQKQIEALTAGLQKVNERLERTTPTPPLLANSR